ncbi:MAG: hypothetical protein PHQ86_01650 [Dehalococcoidales bacterium]|nr:hypothetical protein [Dehalococcoidales bacterium]
MAVERKVYPNNWLLLLFAVFWISDGGLTLWATNHGYMEVWNQWTMLIAHTWFFILIKLMTLALVAGIIRWANAKLPDVTFIALIIFNILVGTVMTANIITVIKS